MTRDELAQLTLIHLKNSQKGLVTTHHCYCKMLLTAGRPEQNRSRSYCSKQIYHYIQRRQVFDNEHTFTLLFPMNIMPQLQDSLFNPLPHLKKKMSQTSWSDSRRMTSWCSDGGWVRSCVHVVTETPSSGLACGVPGLVSTIMCSCCTLTGEVVVVVVVRGVKRLASMSRDNLVQEPYSVSRIL